mgnify:CR=1 FL=1
MKKILLTLALGLGLLTANAQIEKLAGPRLGMTFIGAGPVADFLHDGLMMIEMVNMEVQDQHLQLNMVGNGNQDLLMEAERL